MTPTELAKANRDMDSLPWNTMVRGWRDLRRRLLHPLLLPRPVQVHLVRHGETETNAKALVTGAQDVPLTAKGRAQAGEIGRSLDHYYDFAFHSPMSRSRDTFVLALKSGHVKVGRVISDERLSERSLGGLEGKPWHPIEEYSRGDLHYAPPGGDSYAEVARRALSFLLDLRRLAADTTCSNVLICGHLGPMRILVGILEERCCPAEVLAKSFGNTEVVKLRWSRLRMPEFLNSVSALS
jgi:broad specificity phosphatase PhoE